MRPTLRSGDLLELAPVPARLRPGAVIVFPHPREGRLVVHRVIAVGPSGIATRGDGNRSPDPWLLGGEQPIACVRAVCRGERRLELSAGEAGLIRARVGWARRRAARVASHVLHRPYRALGESGRVAGLLPAALRPRVVESPGRGAPVRRILLGRWVIARMCAGSGSWEVRKPFRLLIAPEMLRPDAAMTPRPVPNGDALAEPAAVAEETPDRLT
jgi:hypothetical protein